MLHKRGGCMHLQPQHVRRVAHTIDALRKHSLCSARAASVAGQHGKQPLSLRASCIMPRTPQAHAFEPLEIAYLARSADTLLCPCDDDQHATDDPPQQRPRWAQAFLRDVFEALAAAKLPPEWRRLNVKFPPYGVPRAGSVQMPVEEGEAQRRARLEAAAAAGALVPRGPGQQG